MDGHLRVRLVDIYATTHAWDLLGWHLANPRIMTKQYHRGGKWSCSYTVEELASTISYHTTLSPKGVTFSCLCSVKFIPVSAFCPFFPVSCSSHFFCCHLGRHLVLSSGVVIWRMLFSVIIWRCHLAFSSSPGIWCCHLVLSSGVFI
jgi:hypothetical protein